MAKIAAIAPQSPLASSISAGLLKHAAAAKTSGCASATAVKRAAKSVRWVHAHVIAVEDTAATVQPLLDQEYAAASQKPQSGGPTIAVGHTNVTGVASIAASLAHVTFTTAPPQSTAIV